VDLAKRTQVTQGYIAQLESGIQKDRACHVAAGCANGLEGERGELWSEYAHKDSVLTKKGGPHGSRPTRSAGLFLLGQTFHHRGSGIRTELHPNARKPSCVALGCCGLDRCLAVYVLGAAVDRVVDRLDTDLKTT